MRVWFAKGVKATDKAKAAIRELVPEKVASVAVIRHAALGDMVLTRCFLVELRKHFPNANITLSLLSNYTRGAPEDLVDRVHVMPGRDRRDTPLREQYKSVKALGYHDLLFDLAATSRSYVLCSLTPAKLKVGFPYRKIHQALVYDIATPRSDLDFEADDMLKMLNALGLRTAYPPQFAMPGEPLKRQRPFFLYFTSASREDKCWPADHFSALLQQMAEAYADHDHLVLRGIDDWESIDQIMQPLQALPNVEAVTADTVEVTVSLVKGAGLLVSNDTGIRHLGIVSETPTVGLFFSTEVFRYWPRYEPHDVVFNADGSVPDVGSVFDAAQRLLEKIGYCSVNSAS
jgi:ADP-heptose:LPS heptosyltransferase